MQADEHRSRRRHTDVFRAAVEMEEPGWQVAGEIRTGPGRDALGDRAVERSGPDQRGERRVEGSQERGRREARGPGGRVARQRHAPEHVPHALRGRGVVARRLARRGVDPLLEDHVVVAAEEP